MSHFKSYLFLIILNLIFRPFLGHAVENPLFGYTHLLPSPFTLPQGRFIFGSTTGVGLTTFLQVETNVIDDLYQIYNARARLSLLDFPGFAGGLYLGYQNVNLNNISSTNPSLTISSWMPGAVLGLEIMPAVALFLGGNLFYSNVDIPDTSTFLTSGFLQGSQVESDLSWAYNSDSSKSGNVLSGGFTYNLTFDFYGMGLSHHWNGFQLGFHYYPNASRLKVMPILSAGISYEL